MALFTSISTLTLSVSAAIRPIRPSNGSKSLSHSIAASLLSSPPSPESKSTAPNQTAVSSSTETSPNPFNGASSRPPEPAGFSYALANGTVPA